MSNKLEMILRRLGRELADHQVARFFKIPEEMVQTPCDLIGYTSTGRAILIEAKMVARASLPLGDSPGLLPHQWCELQDAHRAGALALICWARGDWVATINPTIAINLSEGRASIPWAAISEEYKRPFSMAERLRILDYWLTSTRVA